MAVGAGPWCAGDGHGVTSCRGVRPLSLAPMGMPALDERKPSVVAPAAGSHDEDEWFMEKPKHRLEVDTALIERFNPEGRGAALLKAM